MAHVNKVVRSVEREGGQVCVDIFRRPDGTHGFEEYRRDPEDPRGWAAIGGHAAAVFRTEAEALGAARKVVSWLSGAVE